MKKSNKGIFILLIPIMVLCVIVTGYGININKKLNELKNASAVVIHDVPTTKEDEIIKMTVYVTPSGKKYHLDGCDYLNEKSIKTSLEQAIKSGFDPCSKCQP